MNTHNRLSPRYEIFFALLSALLDPKSLESVQFAYFVSKYGHAKQRRDDGSRYFDHPKSVAWIGIKELGCFDTRFIVDALLHDISEDTYLMSPYRIQLNFGLDVALDVRALTKLPKGKETTEEYLGRIIDRGRCAIMAKLCDRLHNLRTLEVYPEKKQEKIRMETREYHLPLLLPALRACGGVWDQYAISLEEKLIEAMGK